MCGKIRCGRRKSQSQHKGSETTFTPTETAMCTAAQKAGPGNRETKASGLPQLNPQRDHRWINDITHVRKVLPTQKKRKAAQAGAQQRKLSLEQKRNKKGEYHEKIILVWFAIFSGFVGFCRNRIFGTSCILQWGWKDQDGR
jgi:hypothetical protein